MSDDALVATLAAAVERLNATADSWGWPAEEIARIAIRRWESYPGRHRKIPEQRLGHRVLDLAKGMQAHFEPDIPYTSKADWRALSDVLAKLLAQDEDTG